MIPHCTDDVYWYNYDLTFDKSYKKCIYALEKTIRATLEYELWAKNCKTNHPDAVNCPICGDNYYEKSCKCDTHHHPRTLYCIVDDIMTDMINENSMKTTTAFDIVKRVMDLHTNNQVSFINICTHCHKKYHEGNPDVAKKLYDIFEDRIAENKAKINESFAAIGKQENNIISAQINPYDIPKPFIPSPPPQSIDDDNYKITKFKTS